MFALAARRIYALAGVVEINDPDEEVNKLAEERLSAIASLDALIAAAKGCMDVHIMASLMHKRIQLVKATLGRKTQNDKVALALRKVEAQRLVEKEQRRDYLQKLRKKVKGQVAKDAEIAAKTDELAQALDKFRKEMQDAVEGKDDATAAKGFTQALVGQPM